MRPEQRDNHYRIEAYFFVPRSLGISSYTYSKAQFYGDIQAYIRFNTPSVGLGTLLESDNERSPFTALAGALGRAMRSSRDHAAHNVISHELRLLGCLVRSSLRDRVEAIGNELKALRGNADARPTLVHDARESIGALVDELEAVVRRFRSMRLAFTDPVMPPWLREVYQYVDEYLSLSAETFLTLLVENIDHARKVRAALAQERERVCTRLLAEREHRAGAGYETVLEPDTAAENFIYRSGLLKKFVSSVLFLEISKEKEGRRRTELGAAVAAAIAMLFATAAAIASQARWGLNTLPFVLVAVGSYVLKDRIKDWLKHYLSSRMTRLADYDVRIRDPETGVVLGRCREAFSFLSPKRVPKEVLERRRRDAVSVIEAESKPEVVMKYEKDIHLDGRVIGSHYGRMSEINDIIRFNVSHFLARTDDPSRLVRYYDPARDAVESVRCPKVYHVNVVFLLRAQDQLELERVRVVLDKRGIRRLEQA